MIDSKRTTQYIIAYLFNYYISDIVRLLTIFINLPVRKKPLNLIIISSMHSRKQPTLAQVDPNKGSLLAYYNLSKKKAA